MNFAQLPRHVYHLAEEVELPVNPAPRAAQRPAPVRRGRLGSERERSIRLIIRGAPPCGFADTRGRNPYTRSSSDAPSGLSALLGRRDHPCRMVWIAQLTGLFLVRPCARGATTPGLRPPPTGRVDDRYPSTTRAPQRAGVRNSVNTGFAPGDLRSEAGTPLCHTKLGLLPLGLPRAPDSQTAAAQRTMFPQNSRYSMQSLT